jgi:hypothetical protein
MVYTHISSNYNCYWWSIHCERASESTIVFVFILLVVEFVRSHNWWQVFHNTLYCTFQNWLAGSSVPSLLEISLYVHFLQCSGTE